MLNVAVAIDRGHYSSPGGATGTETISGTPEHKITAEIGGMLEKQLKGELFVFNLPRLPNPKEFPQYKRFTSIYDRLKHCAQMFDLVSPPIPIVLVSIHINGSVENKAEPDYNKRTVRGTEVFYKPGEKKNQAASQELANKLLKSIVAYAQNNWDSTWKERRVEIGGNGGLGLIILSKAPATDPTKGGMKEVDFDTRFYGVLVEVGFGDHPKDSVLLDNPYFCWGVGVVMARTIIRWARDLSSKLGLDRIMVNWRRIETEAAQMGLMIKY